MTSRRQLLKTGVLGGLMLAGVGAWMAHRSAEDAAGTSAGADGSTGRNAAPSALNPAARACLAALAPVLIGSACATPEAVRRAVEGVDQAVSRLSPATQKEVGELFMLLTFAPTRAVAAGLWVDWPQASAEQIGAFLERWRSSRLALLQSGYHALHDLLLGAWYADERSWASIGYPGPPSLGAAS